MKAILVIDTDAEHIEDLHISMIWNDVYPVDLGKDVYFKPMPTKKNEEIVIKGHKGEIAEAYQDGWNDCLKELEK